MWETCNISWLSLNWLWCGFKVYFSHWLNFFHLFISVFPDLSCRIGGNGNPGLKRKNSDPDQESVDSNRKREIIGPNEDIDSESKKQKKVRTTFTGRQIFELEKMFETKKYLSSSERTELAKMLNVTEQQVIHSSGSYGKIQFLKAGLVCTLGHLTFKCELS